MSCETTIVVTGLEASWLRLSLGKKCHLNPLQLQPHHNKQRHMSKTSRRIQASLNISMYKGSSPSLSPSVYHEPRTTLALTSARPIAHGTVQGKQQVVPQPGHVRYIQMASNPKALKGRMCKGPVCGVLEQSSQFRTHLTPCHIGCLCHLLRATNGHKAPQHTATHYNTPHATHHAN